MNKTDNVIVLKKDDKIEVYGSLTEVCKLKGFSRNTLYRKTYPFTYRGIEFTKVKGRTYYGIDSN